MGEAGGANIEVAHHLGESHGRGEPHRSRAHEILEIVEAIVLALVAVTTAWSSYQAAQWDGNQDQFYEQSTRLRVEAEGLKSRGGQEQLHNSGTVNEWLKAEFRGQTKLAELYERRLLPGFRPAFEAWKKLDPINNPNAPAGPMLMPEYHDAKQQEAIRLDQEAAEAFERGQRARERADAYIRVTVILATVLLLTAISQRFKTHGVRVALIGLAFLLLCIPLYRLLTLPRA